MPRLSMLPLSPIRRTFSGSTVGRDPTLIHDGRPLHEAARICEYLDETTRTPPAAAQHPLLPAPRCATDRHLDGLSGTSSASTGGTIWRRRVAMDRSDSRKLKTIPSKERQEAWLAAARSLPRGRARRRAGQLITQLLDKMEGSAEGRRGCRQVLSIADIAARHS